MTTTVPILPAPGLHRNVHEDVYGAWPALRTSTLKAALSSWRHFRSAEMFYQEPTDAMLAGRALHLACFEPDRFASEVAERPTFSGTGARAARAEFDSANADKIILSASAMQEVSEWARAIRADATAAKVLVLPAESEVSMVWADAKTGIECKGRMDRLIRTPGGYLIVDVKSAVDASPRKFAAAAMSLGYDLQAAQYVDGLLSVVGDAPVSFLWIVVEKSAPWNVCVYDASEPECEPDMLTNGRMRRDRLLAGLLKCRKTGLYPGYVDGITPLRVPHWAIEEGADE